MPSRSRRRRSSSSSSTSRASSSFSAEAGFAGYARTERDSGHVVYACEDADGLSRALPWASLIFARQKLRLLADLRGLDPRDRIAPMLAALQGRARFGTLVMEHPDSDAAKPLAGLARSLGNALRPALRKAGLLSAQDDARLPRLHVCFVAGDHALLAASDPADSAPWPLGIPRLRMPKAAPSRSTLKLAEAIAVFLGDRERDLLHEGQSAVDLGAAPGGWTWLLASRGLHVAAVDNGALAPALAPDAPHRAIVVDLSGVDYISSVGLRVLMVAAKTMRARRAAIAVASLQPVVAAASRGIGSSSSNPGSRQRQCAGSVSANRKSQFARIALAPIA